MFTPTTRTTTTETFQSRQTPAVFSRPGSARDAQDAPRAGMTMPRTQATTDPEDWTRECLFDCYND